MNFDKIKIGETLNLNTRGKSIRVKITRKVKKSSKSDYFQIYYDYLDGYSFMGCEKGVTPSEDGEFESLTK